MNGWNTVALADVAQVFNGKTPSKAEQRSHGHPVLKIKDVTDLGDFRGTFESFVDPDFADLYASKRLREGDTLILNAAHNANYVGSKTYRVQRPTVGALATGEWLVIRPVESRLNPGFTFYWINSAGTRLGIRDMVKGIHLYPKDVARLRITLPPLAEQQRIAEILDKADALRAKRRAALAHLDSLTQSIFLDLFGDPINDACRFPIRQLEHAIDLRGGFAFRSSDYVSDGIPLVRIGEVNRGIVSRDSACFLPVAYQTGLTRFVVRPGDLLMSLTGTTGKDDYANVMLLDTTFDRYFLNQRVALIEPKPNIVERCYLFHILRNPRVKSRLTAKSRGIRQANISNHDVLELEIPIPPMELQRQFRRSVEAVEKLKAVQRASLAEMDALFASLQHRAFNGQL